MCKILLPVAAALLLAGSFIGSDASAKDYSLLSPDGRTAATVSVSDDVTFSIVYGGNRIMEPGAIGLDVEGKGFLGSGPKVRKVSRQSVDRVLEATVPLKFRLVRDCFNELRLDFVGDWSIVLRVYDNGAAYRFETRFPGTVHVTDEKADYNFSDDCSVYWANEEDPEFITHCEAFFQEMKISEVDPRKYCYLPVSLRTPAGTRVVMTETDLTDYPNLFLFRNQQGGLTGRFPREILETEMRTDRDVNVVRKADYIAETSGTRTFPWRIFMLGDDRSLLENDLAWQLAPEQVQGETDWIRPGKISWEWWSGLNVYGVDFEAGVNTQTYEYYIDFAAAKGIEYILLDEGWSAGTSDVIHPMPGLDIRELAEYGRSKGVGVVLWTLWTPVMADMGHILDVYADWGVSGIKIDFMQRTDRPMVNFYEDVARECFERRLLVDFHGSFKPAGLQRKYPNVMSFEGVYGMEHDKDSRNISPEHDLVLPFTRMAAGPMDYTPGATINATKDDYAIRWNHPMSQGTRAHQAAIYIAYESAVQMLCDSPSNYYKTPEFTDFIASVPTVWDETRAIEAVAGDYLLIARRSGDTWFVAGLNDWTPRELSLPLDFLSEGEYVADIFMDGVNANAWAEDFKCLSAKVGAEDTLPVKMAAGGGWAAVIRACAD